MTSQRTLMKQPTAEELQKAVEFCERNYQTYTIDPRGRGLFIHGGLEEIAAFEQTAAGIIATNWPELLATAMREYRRKQRRQENKAAKKEFMLRRHYRVRRARWDRWNRWNRLDRRLRWGR